MAHWWSSAVSASLNVSSSLSPSTAVGRVQDRAYLAARGPAKDGPETTEAIAMIPSATCNCSSEVCFTAHGGA